MSQAPVIARRDCLRLAASLGAAPLLGAVAAPAWAGGQLEEPLADSVRTALSSAVTGSAPPELRFASTEARMDYLRWLTASSERLRSRKPELATRLEFLQTVWYESKRAGLEVSLVMGLVQVESAFRKFAISSVGALGLVPDGLQELQPSRQFRLARTQRSEERRVGKECRSRWSPYH